MLICTSSKKGQFFEIVHQDAHGLVKLVILIWLISLFVMPTKLPTYLPNICLCPTYVLPTYLHTIFYIAKYVHLKP